MYTYLDSVVLSRTIGAQWSSMDLQDTIVNQIYQAYSKTYIRLSNPMLVDPIWIDMAELAQAYGSYMDTLNQMLVVLEDTSLTAVTPPSTEVKIVKYADAFRTSYKIDMVNTGRPVPPNFPVGDIRDLKLTRPVYKTDTTLIHDYCLVSVNGIIHPTDKDDEFGYVLEGATSFRKVRDNHLGIHSFLDIGKLTKYQLQADAITTDPEQSLYNNLRFSIPADITNKSVFLVLGGYLVFLDESNFNHIGDNVFHLNLSGLQLAERILESSQYIELHKYLDIPTSLANESLVNITELFTDEMILKYLQLPFTFLVTVDVANLLVESIEIRSCNIPGMFTAYNGEHVTYPLLTGHGKIAEYWSRYDEGFYSVTVGDPLYRNYVISYKPLWQQSVINNSAVSTMPHMRMGGHFLRISGFN